MTMPVTMQSCRPARLIPALCAIAGAAIYLLPISDSDGAVGIASRLASSLSPPSAPPSGTCSSTRGGPDGRWERDVPLADLAYYEPTYPAYNTSNPAHRPSPDDPEGTMHRKPTTYAWRDPPEVESRCARIAPLTAAAFCAEVRRLGIDRIVFVGDSIMFQQSYALVLQIGHDIPHKDPKTRRNSAGSWTSAYECPGDEDGGGGGQPVELQFLRNDFLIYGNMVTNSKSLPGKPVLKDWIGPYRLASSSARTLLVVNTGAHFKRGQKPSYEDVVMRFVADAGTKFGRPNDLVFWRTTPGGHPTCGTATEPFRTQEEYYESIRRPPKKRRGNVKAYGWGDFDARNDYAKEALGRYNSDVDASTAPTGPARIHVLDVVPMTNLRPDGHQASPDNLYPQKPTNDCLHYSMPGPIDWFNNLLWANLADFPSIGSGEVGAQQPHQDGSSQQA